ncbi:sigma-E factor regulatory protein RseB [Caviibacterium pharyngocola]|uniref:Sigma-E factor regulatory protein RseB n=1 Tax=Caviibacterium pharyngocola TaxID=28159 RepID=A0A2M8RTK6_9PAST|nr:sigma-E factor regulatory protein RseB [Caviibacterium pharyngocola]PJG82184.1 sigma-E factor regulatory protein RseB [Caviibacterium pharyngocola]
MLKTLKKFTALSFLLVFSSGVFAQQALEPKQLLEAMREAKEKLNYEIAFVQTTPVNMESLRYRHLNYEGKTYAQLITLDGVPQEIVQRNGVISYFQPNYQAFSINGNHIVDSLPSVLRSNFEVLAKYYDFINIGRNRVADRVVQTVRILPKDDFRYQYLVFIDENNHLLLRSDMLDREGNLLEQFRVVNLYIGDGLQQLSGYLDNVVFPPLLTEASEKDAPKTRFDWHPSWLPKGFELINASVEVDGDNTIESQLYSDGLFSFTVYRSDTIIPQEPENAWKQGPTTFYTENKNGKEMTFIGQLPISTAKRIVQDIQFK